MADSGAAPRPPWLPTLPAALHRIISRFWSPAATAPSPPQAEWEHGDDDGSRFFDAQSRVWQRHPSVARFNPPAPTLPLPFQYYGQPFYKGFSWETKV